MKRNLLFAVLVLWTCTLVAQIEVGMSTLPQVGDSLYTETDAMPGDITVVPSGSTPTWDFSTLEAPFVTETIYKDADESENADDFLSATMFTETAAGELFYRSEDNSFDFVGYTGADPAGLGLDLAARFLPYLVDREVPMNLNDSYDYTSQVAIPFSLDDLPAALLDSIDLPITPDSLRVLIEINRSHDVDEFGSLAIPDGTFEVLRMKRFETAETKLEAKISFLPWFDVSDLIPVPIFGIDTTVTYLFYSDNSKEAIAEVVMEDDESAIDRVTFKSIDPATALIKLDDGKPQALAYPNPAIDNVRFDFANLPTGDYSLTIYNLLGLPVWSEIYSINGSKTIQLNVSDYKEGTYLYSLTNDKGKSLMTKRLVIIRP